jgi:hypothetical protein
LPRLLPVVLLGAWLFVNCGQSEQHYATDCRDAAQRSSRYKEQWDKHEIHYNRRDHGCYLSLEGSEFSPSGKMRAVAELVVDVNENREILNCSCAQAEGTPLIWFCLDRGDRIERERFLEVRKQYLEP